MTKSVTSRALALSCVVLFAILLGCGGDKDAPVYDTVANPHGLPIQACELIDGIEAGRLVSYDVITEAFGRLYLENQELLENKHWKEIIARLGGKFHRRADELIKNGIQSYSQAAGFYMLASFSNPDDAELMEKAALFTTWKEMMESVGSEYVCSPTSEHIADRLDFVRHFVFGDRLHREFAEQFLVHQVLDSLVTSVGDKKLAELSAPDQALLAMLKLNNREPGKSVGQFAGPAVDLIAYRFVAVADRRSRLELYMSPLEDLAADLRVQLSFDIQAPGDNGEVRTETVVKEFDFITPADGRMPGETIVAATVLAHNTELANGRIQLVSSDMELSGGGSSSISLSLVAETPCSR